MNWDEPPPNFSYVLFERVDLAKNIDRFYFIAFQTTLLGPAVIRMWGRKGHWQRQATPRPFDSLEEAWPLIRAVIKTRLRNGYRVVEPVEFGD
jgi:predicted DNA-binding WGR domain protein